MKEPFGYTEFQMEWDERHKNFLKSRKSEKTKEVIRVIIRELKNARDTDPFRQGWIKSSDLYERIVPELIPENSESSFYKILKDMVKGHIILSKTGDKQDKPGRVPEYYQLPIAYGSLYFMKKEELINEVLQSYENMGKVSMRLFAATRLLAQCHAGEPNFMTRDAIKKETLRIFPDYGKSKPIKKRAPRRKRVTISPLSP